LLVDALDAVEEQWSWDEEDVKSKARVFVRVMHAIGVSEGVDGKDDEHRQKVIARFKQSLQRHGFLKRAR
jgi:hypothetical protein